MMASHCVGADCSCCPVPATLSLTFAPQGGTGCTCYGPVVVWVRDGKSGEWVVLGEATGAVAIDRGGPTPDAAADDAAQEKDECDRGDDRWWLHDHFRGLARRHQAAADLALARLPRARREPRRRARGDCLPQRLRG